MAPDPAAAAEPRQTPGGPSYEPANHNFCGAVATACKILSDYNFLGLSHLSGKELQLFHAIPGRGAERHKEGEGFLSPWWWVEKREVGRLGGHRLGKDPEPQGPDLHLQVTPQ